MVSRTASRVIADGATFAAGETRSVDVSGFHTPSVCIDVGGADTVTVEIVGDAGTYTVDERSPGSATSYIVDCPQADQIQVTSTDGTTISAEARNNPR